MKSFSRNDFLDAHHLYDNANDKKYPEMEVMTYVTPWNRKGKDHVKLMANKINWVSPCWYQIRRETSSGIVIAGKHDEDWDWIGSLFEGEGESDQCRQDLFVVPRVAFETPLSNAQDVADVARILVEKMNWANALVVGGNGNRGIKYIHGFTLEIPLSQLQTAVNLLKVLKETDATMKIVFVLPPIDVKIDDTNSHAALQHLSTTVDRFSVMTYDDDRNGAPNSPINWVTTVISGLAQVPTMREKVLLGMPFYGWRTGGEDMTAEKMILWLAQDSSVKINFDEETQEHYYTDNKERRASFPSPYMLKKRVDLAKSLGVAGVAAWEAGQMPAAFIDVL
jgi:chitinase domain-containing protein 1